MNENAELKAEIEGLEKRVYDLKFTLEAEKIKASRIIADIEIQNIIITDLTKYKKLHQDFESWLETKEKIYSKSDVEKTLGILKLSNGIS